MIDKPMEQDIVGVGALAPDELMIDVEVAPDDESLDGVEVLFGGPVIEIEANTNFGENLANSLDENVLSGISDQLLGYYQSDVLSRADWERTYKEGLELLGLKIEDRTEPWDGACGVSHPLLAEAVVKFQSEAIMETFPASGPVKTQIIGKCTKEKEEAANRVRDDMNWYLTEKMPDYRAEHERMLWNLPVAGSALKKVYFDPATRLPVSVFIPAEDFIAPFGATSLHTAPRYAHRMKKTRSEVKRLIAVGFYRDVDLGEPMADLEDIQKAKDEYSGEDSQQDDRYTFLEYHVELDIPGYESKSGVPPPYVVHMEKTTGKVMAIYRNWFECECEEAVESVLSPVAPPAAPEQKRIHFAKYDYIPGFGFYGFGLIHLVGGFAKGATSIIRQLVDAGTLANLPGGLKTRGLRLHDKDSPIGPGEFRDADVPSGTIKDNLMVLPFKEPSQVLFQLLENIVAEGRRFAAVADINVADIQPNAPVGSTLAILERTLKTMSAIQARIHAAMKQEFKILKEIVRDQTQEDYDYDADAPDGKKAKQADYDVVEIIPVSDPNATTMSQRLAQYQAALQLAQSAPQIYDLPVLHRQMLEELGVKNAEKLVPTKDDVLPTDPVSENMALLTGQPVKAFLTQDHQAHLAAHHAFIQDPKLQSLMQNDPTAQSKLAAAMAHINEHLAFAYRQEIEKQLGVALPPPEEKLPPEIEVNLSQLVAQAAQKLLQQNTAEMQQKQIQQQMQDPIVQMQQQELQLKAGELKRKTDKDLMDHQVEVERLKLEAAKMQSAEQVKGTEIGAKIGLEREKMRHSKENERDKNDALDRREGFKAGVSFRQGNARAQTKKEQVVNGQNSGKSD